MKIIKKRLSLFVIIIIIILLMLTVMTHLTVSYFVRKKTADNYFNVSLTELTVVEDSFPQQSKDKWVVPKGFLPKDPHIINTGSSDVYAFAEITVPYDEVIMISEQGENKNLPEPQGKKNAELFNIISNDEECISADETESFREAFGVTDNAEFSYDHNWIFLSSKEDQINKTHSYLFGYTSILTTETGRNYTSNIFDKIQLRNILEGCISENAVRTVTISAYGLQSEELRADVEPENKQKITRDEMLDIYRIYKNQES